MLITKVHKYFFSHKLNEKHYLATIVWHKQYAPCTQTSTAVLIMTFLNGPMSDCIKRQLRLINWQIFTFANSFGKKSSKQSGKVY